MEPTNAHLEGQILALARQRLKADGVGLSLCLMEPCGNELLSIGAGQIKPSASTIKLAILLALLEQVDAGHHQLHERIAITPANRVGGTGVLHGLPSVAQLTLSELCRLMMVVSDNTATNQLIDLLGFGAINQCLQVAGLGHSALRRKMMDSEAQKAGRDNTTCARDLCLLMARLQRADSLSAAMQSFALDLMATERHQPLLCAALPAGVQASNKTGQLPDLRNDAVVFTYGERSLILAVMATGFQDAVTSTSIYGGQGELLLAEIGALVCRTCLKP
ncbi:MAG: serine hydrolase [Comamonas sp.]